MKTRGFSIPELMVVIAVISILAAVTIVGYGAWRQNIAASAVQSDLINAKSAMDDVRAWSDDYPVYSDGAVFDGTGETADVYVSSDDVTITYFTRSDNQFCLQGQSVSQDDVSYYFDVSAGMTEPAEGDCIFFGGDVIYDGPIAGDLTYFVFNTEAAGCSANTIGLPVDSPSSVSSATVYWGDGTTDTFTGVGQSHTYSSPGTYGVAYDGGIDAIDTGPVASGSRACLEELSAWSGDVSPTSISFSQSGNLAYVAEPPTTVTDMSSMFTRATNFNQDISGWDVSNVVSMDSMFAEASSFNQPLDSWDTSSVTTMAGMFTAATSFDQPLASWDVTSVTTMSEMFMDATSFNQPLYAWSTSSLTNTSYMFANATSFNSPCILYWPTQPSGFPTDGWEMTYVTTAQGMFQGASAFNQPVWMMFSNALQDISYFMDGASSFNNIIQIDSTSNLTNTSYMFRNASSYVGDYIDIVDTSAVTTMDYMFHGTTVFNQDLSAWDVSSVATYNSFATSSALDPSYYPVFP